MTRVLLVDDARLLAELEGTPMDRSSVELLILGPDQDLPAAAAQWLPDVIILGEGEFCPEAFDTCIRLREQPETRGIPIIYFGLGLHRDRCLSAGASFFLPRPVTRRDLRHAIQKALSLKERATTRRRVDLPVHWENEAGTTEGNCRDLSLSGAFVHFGHPPEVGQRGMLRFWAGGRPLFLAAEVVRLGPGPGGLSEGNGLRFLQIEADTGAFLSRFVRTSREKRTGVPSLEEHP